jgi:hypothetical protein
MSQPESSPSSTPSPSSALGTRTLGAGALGGVLAYLLGYALTYAATGQRIENSIASRILEVATGDPGTWKIVGWVFYNEHFVTTEIPGLLGSTATNFVGGEDGFAAALFLLPPVLLLLAGGVAAAVSHTETPLSGALSGATVLLGYLPLGVVGAFLFGIDVGDATAGPTLVTAILLVGIVYPLVFGAVGGAVGSLASGE